MQPQVVQALLMYFVLPLWLAAGLADYLCHRSAGIEMSSGPKESILHLLQFGDMAVPVVAALFLEINASVILIMIASFILHQATAICDVHYAYATRDIKPIEQHVHSVLEMLPLMGLLLIVVAHWDQFLALLGLGAEIPRFALAFKPEPLPWLYVLTALAAALLLVLLPYGEELTRGLRAQSSARRSD